MPLQAHKGAGDYTSRRAAGTVMWKVSVHDICTYPWLV
jgi:hypothetical protein